MAKDYGAVNSLRRGMTNLVTSAKAVDRRIGIGKDTAVAPGMRSEWNRQDTEMKRIILMAAALAASVGAAEAQDMRMRIHNDTGMTLYKFYSTNTGSTRWGSDVMGASTIATGSSMKLNFANAEGYCLFDFRAIFEDGTELTRQGVNVCEMSDYYYQP